MKTHYRENPLYIFQEILNQSENFFLCPKIRFFLVETSKGFLFLSLKKNNNNRQISSNEKAIDCFIDIIKSSMSTPIKTTEARKKRVTYHIFFFQDIQLTIPTPNKKLKRRKEKGSLRNSKNVKAENRKKTQSAIMKTTNTRTVINKRLINF